MFARARRYEKIFRAQCPDIDRIDCGLDLIVRLGQHHFAIDGDQLAVFVDTTRADILQRIEGHHIGIITGRDRPGALDAKIFCGV